MDARGHDGTAGWRGKVAARFHRAGRFLRYIGALARESFRGFLDDQGMQKAASLSFQTLLSIVPLFTVAFVLLNAFGGFGGESPVVLLLSRHLIPVSSGEIVGWIAEFSRRTRVETVGWVGVGFLVLTSVLMLDTVESAMNAIWKVRSRRPLVLRVITYYSVLTLGPLLVAISLYESARLQVFLPRGVVAAMPRHLVPLAITWTALVLAYKLFPHTRVRWKSVFLGALVGAILFELAKYGFSLYVTNVLMRPYARIYGTIALVPVFLIWVFYAWTVVLFGVEVTYVHQHLRRILYERGVVRVRGLRPAQRFLMAGEQTALRALVLVGQSFVRGGGPVSDVDLALATGTIVDVMQSVLDRLQDLGYLVAADGEETTVFLPARPLSDIRVAEVLSRYRGQGEPCGPPPAGIPAVPARPGPSRPAPGARWLAAEAAEEVGERLRRVDCFLAALDKAVGDAADGTTLADLVGEGEKMAASRTRAGGQGGEAG